MFSAKHLHRQAIEREKSHGTNQVLGPALHSQAPKVVQPSQTGVEGRFDATNGMPFGEPLLKAVISAQKTTIAGFQLDLEEANAKIKMLKGKCADAEALAVKRVDYNRLQAQCQSGYESGVTHGISKVRFST